MSNRQTLKKRISATTQLKRLFFIEFCFSKIFFFIFIHWNWLIAAHRAWQICDLKNWIMAVHFSFMFWFFTVDSWSRILAWMKENGANLTCSTCNKQTEQMVFYQLTFSRAHRWSSVCFQRLAEELRPEVCESVIKMHMMIRRPLVRC